MTSPATTVPLSPLRMLISTPSTGEGSSSTTLSVSMSIRFSSRLTASPCFLCQESSVASATDSESCGTLTSTSMLSPLPAGALHRHDDVVCDRRERGLDQLLLLLGVQRQIADRRRRRGLAHRVAEHLLRTHVAQQIVLDAMPRALVAGFLLAPEHLVRVRVAIDLLLEIVVRERVELRDAPDGDVLDALLLAVGHQVEEHLAGAEDDALHLRRLDRLVPVSIDRLEFALRELRQRRHRLLVPQQALRREDDERLAVRADHLPAQQEEHLHRRRGDAYLDVVVGAQLQKALRAARGMLGTLPFKAVRQHHHHSADAAPFHLARGDEL